MRTSTSFGFSREGASQQRFHFSIAPGRKFSITIWQPRARRRTIAWPSDWRRSTVIDFLLRDCTCHQSDTPFRMRRQRRLAALVDHLVGEAHEPAVALRSEAVLDHFAFDVDRIADDGGRFDAERAVEEGEPGVLHGGQEQALGE